MMSLKSFTFISLFFTTILLQAQTQTLTDECPNIDFRCPKGKFPLHLTFDDGPAKQTKNILSILREYDVRATFFMQGEKLISPDGKRFKNPQVQELLREMRSQGHIIGSHTYHHIRHLDEALHRNKYKVDMEMLRKSGLSWNGNFEVMKRPGPLQEFLVDQKKQYIRLPYGQGWFKARTGPAPDTVVLKELLKKTSSEATPTHVGWNIDPQDWTNPSTTEYLTTVRDQICRGEGGIVLMHDHTRATNQNLACFIRLAKEAGHRFEDRPDRFVEHRDGPGGPKVLMTYRDIPGIHKTPEQNCEEDAAQESVDKLDDSATMILNHLRSDPSYTRSED